MHLQQAQALLRLEQEEDFLEEQMLEPHLLGVKQLSLQIHQQVVLFSEVLLQAQQVRQLVFLEEILAHQQDLLHLAGFLEEILQTLQEQYHLETLQIQLLQQQLKDLDCKCKDSLHLAYLETQMPLQVLLQVRPLFLEVPLQVPQEHQLVYLVQIQLQPTQQNP